MPQPADSDRYWAPYEEALGQVLDAGADPVQAAKSACAGPGKATG